MSSIESTNTFASLIDEKFNELKISLIDEHKAALDKYFEEKKTEFQAFVAANMPVSTVFNNDAELRESIQITQNHVSEHLRLKEENNKLKDKVEGLEQYGRRPNLRIFGLPLPAKETSDEVRRKVAKLISDSDIEVPVSSIDRAHRIGKVTKNKSDQNIQPIIVRFSAFSDRTLVYRGPKKIKEKNLGISLDLTFERYGLLKQAGAMIEDVVGKNLFMLMLTAN